MQDAAAAGNAGVQRAHTRTAVFINREDLCNLLQQEKEVNRDDLLQNEEEFQNAVQQAMAALGGGEYLRLLEEDGQVEPQYSIDRALIRCI